MTTNPFKLRDSIKLLDFTPRTVCWCVLFFLLMLVAMPSFSQTYADYLKNQAMTPRERAAQKANKKKTAFLEWVKKHQSTTCKINSKTIVKHRDSIGYKSSHVFQGVLKKGTGRKIIKPKTAVHLKNILQDRTCSIERISQSVTTVVLNYKGHYPSDFRREEVRATESMCYVPEKTWRVLPDKINNKDTDIREWPSRVANQYKSACVNYFEKQFFAPEVRRFKAELKEAAEKARKEEKRRIAAAKAAKARAERFARQQKAVLAISDSKGYSRDETFLWGHDNESKASLSSNQRVNRPPSPSFKQLSIDFNEKRIENQPPMPELKKGEFEKTADFEKRLAQSRSEHKAALTEAEKIWKTMRLDVLLDKLTNQLGVPMIDSLKYDADRESFLATIASEKTSFSIQTQVSVPISEAKSKKSTLMNSLPWVLFRYNDNHTIQVAEVYLQEPKTGAVLSAAIETNPRVPVRFDAASAAEYQSEIKNEKMAANARKAAARCDSYRQALAMRGLDPWKAKMGLRASGCE